MVTIAVAINSSGYCGDNAVEDIVLMSVLATVVIAVMEINVGSGNFDGCGDAGEFGGSREIVMSDCGGGGHQ